MRWKLGQNHRRRPTSPKEDVSYKIVISLSQKEDKKTATTTSAVHTWTAFRYSGRSWARQLFDPTGALLATLTGALHRGCTAAPTPKLLPARGRVQGFMEAYWTNFLEEFNFCLPDDGSWKNLHSVKFGCLKRCLWWGVSVIIVDKRNQKLISCKTNLKHKDTLTSSGSFVLENPTTFYQTHCCCTGCFIQLTIFQQNEKSSGIFLLLLKSVFGCISSVFTQIYPVFVSLLSFLLQHTFKITVIFCCCCLVSKIRHTCSWCSISLFSSSGNIMHNSSVCIVRGCTLSPNCLILKTIWYGPVPVSQQYRISAEDLLLQYYASSNHMFLCQRVHTSTCPQGYGLIRYWCSLATKGGRPPQMPQSQ